MKAEERRQKIVDRLVADGSATLDDLARRFDVSRMTVHRDLDDLERGGLLRKVRGGATMEASDQFESDFRYRERMAVGEKRLIARHAAAFVEPGMSVMIDDGSTAKALVPFLRPKRPLTVITNNLGILTDLAGEPGLTLIALGGTYAAKFNGFFGLLTEQTLDALRANIAFMSSSAIDGVTAFHQDQEVVEVKRRMIAAATRRYLLVDHQKFGRTALHRLAGLVAFDGVVTTDALPRERAEALAQADIALHFAQEE